MPLLAVPTGNLNRIDLKYRRFMTFTGRNGGEDVFSITGEENLPVLAGLAIGGTIGLIILFGLGFTRIGGSEERVTAGRILRQAAATFGARAGALVTLWIGVSLAYTIVTLFAQLVGRTTNIFEGAMAAALIFLGHKTMLERPARSVGIEVPQTGFWRILMRSLALGLTVLATAAVVFVLAALLVALAEIAGLVGNTPRIVVGALSGGIAIWLSPLFARLSFIYPSSVLGGRDWYGTALNRARPAALGLGAGLWLVALASLALIVPLIIWSNTLVLAIATDLPSQPGDLPDDIGTPLFWLSLVMEELPLRLLLVAYSLASIACVSAAYRLTVLTPEKPGSHDQV
ncbi:hypothetical protein C7435_1092 [Maricaulis maris]|uniref:Uncharacterized protein n=1 Tax=Maricaulis maris TaxID=74318 RepID=A0A495DKJ6_9PROT|nr:hypothetical protein C7435_1092 [Maricaulis maris]